MKEKPEIVCELTVACMDMQPLQPKNSLHDISLFFMDYMSFEEEHECEIV